MSVNHLIATSPSEAVILLLQRNEAAILLLLYSAAFGAANEARCPWQRDQSPNGNKYDTLHLCCRGSLWRRSKALSLYRKIFPSLIRRTKREDENKKKTLMTMMNNSVRKRLDSWGRSFPNSHRVVAREREKPNDDDDVVTFWWGRLGLSLIEITKSPKKKLVF